MLLTGVGHGDRRHMRWRWPNPKHESLTPAADWLLDKEIRRKGDWSIKRPNTEPSGWAFEYCNEYYPDIDDTAMVMLSLSEVRGIQPRGAEGGVHGAGWTGCWPCNRAMAAGRRSTPTTTGSS